MRQVKAIAIAGLAATALLANEVEAQGLARRITGAPDGEVRMTFASRPEVCGDGVNNIRWGSRNRRHQDDDDVVYGDDGTCPCGKGPVRVVFKVRDHHVSRVRTAVGGEWRADSKALDLGTGLHLAREVHLVAEAGAARGFHAELQAERTVTRCGHQMLHPVHRRRRQRDRGPCHRTLSTHHYRSLCRGPCPQDKADAAQGSHRR